MEWWKNGRLLMHASCLLWLFPIFQCSYIPIFQKYNDKAFEFDPAQRTGISKGHLRGFLKDSFSFQNLKA
jgi:hypothetical protein